MLDIRPMTVHEALSEMGGLSIGHQVEMESHIPLPLMPHFAAYLNAEKSRALVVIGAFDGETPVGYAVAWLYRHPHYEVLIAQHDLIYLAPSHRKGRAGLRLMRALSREAKAKGAAYLVWAAKPGSTFDSLLRRLGVPCEERLYREVLA